MKHFLPLGFCLFLFLFTPFESIATTENITIAGRVENHNGRGETAMPITFQAQIDGQIKSIIQRTDENGRFSIDVPKGEWRVFIDKDVLLSRGHLSGTATKVGPTSNFNILLKITPIQPQLRPKLNNRGDLFLDVQYDSPETRAIHIPRKYKIQSSTDLQNWTDIALSDSDNPGELQDLAASKENSCYYRAVLVDPVTEPTPEFLISIEEYYEQLHTLEGFKSGLLLNGVSIGDIESSRSLQSELKAALEAIIAHGNQPDENLLKTFHDQLNTLDDRLSSNPLVVKIDDVAVEIEVSEAMRVLTEEYRRLGLVSLSDYARLPGINAEDLDGHESLAEFLESRQVGVTTQIPVFQSLSPYGNYTLIHALVLKYGSILLENTNDSDNDGIQEIDYALLRRLINGTELIYREAIALVQTIIQDNPIGWNKIEEPPIEADKLKTVLETLSFLHEELRSQTESLVTSKSIEPVFEKQVLREINNQIWQIYTSDQMLLRTKLLPPDVSLDIIPASTVTFPENPATPLELRELIKNLEIWQNEIRESLLSFMENLSISNQVKTDFEQILLHKLNGYWNHSTYITGIYESVYEQSYEEILYGSVKFDIPGVGKVLLDQSLDSLIASLPWSIEELLKFPGIASVLNEEQLNLLHKQSEWNLLENFRFDYPELRQTPYLSIFGKRIELIELLLHAFGTKVVADHSIDQDAFFRTIVMDVKIEEHFDSAIGLIESSLQSVHEISDIRGHAIAKDDYLALLEILKTTKRTVEDLLIPDVDNTAYQARNLVQSSLQRSFDLLTDEIKSLLLSGNVRIEIDGSTHTVYAPDIVSLLDALAQQTGVIPPYGKPSRRNYARLNGITEEPLLGLIDTYEWSQLKRINLSYRNETPPPSIDSRPDEFALQFSLVPEILESFGSQIINSTNRIDTSLLKTALLDGVYTPVRDGETIWNTYRQHVKREITNTRNKLTPLNFRNWSSHLEAENHFLELYENLRTKISPLITEVSQMETNILNQDTQWGTYLNYTRTISLRDVWETFDAKKRVSNVYISMKDSTIIDVPLQAIKSIPSFPRNKNFDKTLFVGINDSDLEATDALSRQFVYNFDTDDLFDFPFSNNLDRDKFVMNIVTRYYENLPQFPEFIQEDLFKSGQLNLELFRRLVKGVDIMHQQAIEETKRITDDAMAKLADVSLAPMTIAQVRNVYDVVAKNNQNIVAYLNELTNLHEREDVIEIEESVSAIHKNLVDLMIQYLRNNDLVVYIDDIAIKVPVYDILNPILAQLEKRFPGEDIGAHHFATFFGISVEELRRYNKLENFLGVQIIALPRNSVYVEILSKLSEIGVMELTSQLISDLAAEVVDTDTQSVNIPLLMEYLIDEDYAVKRAKLRANEITEATIIQIQTLETPNTVTGFEIVAGIYNQWKLDITNALNDYVSGFSESMLKTVQAHANSLHENVIATRDNLLVNQPINFTTLDGQSFSVNISDIESETINEMLVLIEAAQRELDTPEPYTGLGIVGEKHSIIDTELVSIPIWNPLPPATYNSADTLTQFGFHQLLAKLIYKYDASVLIDGEFSFEKFISELGRTNEDRAQEKFDILKSHAIAELETLVSDNDSPIHLDDVDAVHNFLDDTKTQFLEWLTILLGDELYYESNITAAGNEAWASVMDRYEDLLFHRPVSLSVNRTNLTLDVESLIDLMEENYNEGNTSFLDEYAKGGETIWDYQHYQTLRQTYWWDFYPSRDDSGASSQTFTEMENTSLPIPRYTFNLGDLNSIPGINSNDLTGLDVESKANVRLSLIDPKELLKGRLNMRIFGPGSSIQTIGAPIDGSRDAGESTSGSIELSGDLRVGAPIFIGYGFNYASIRDIRFRIIPQIIVDNAEKLIDENGNLDLTALLKLIEDDQ